MPAASGARNPVVSAYRAQAAAIRRSVIDRVTTLYGRVLDPSDIAGSFDTFIESAESVVAAGQASLTTLVAAFIRSYSAGRGQLAEPLDDIEGIVGTTRDGASLSEGMAAIGPMVLGQIAQGKAIDEAMAFGEYLSTRFADNELTGAADRELEQQSEAIDVIIGWEGIVQAGACDPCQDNAGPHGLDDEVYRHPSCNCEKVPLYAPAVVEETGTVAAELRSLAETAEPDVSVLMRELEETTGGELAGFDFRLKTEARIAEKVLMDVVEGKGTVEQVGLAINDSLRYTLRYDGRDAYMAGVAESIRTLEARGIQLLKAPKNFWGKPGYQGINSVFVGPAGVRFELQFHTSASLVLKEPSHLLYEQLRVATDPRVRARLEDEIETLWRGLQQSADAKAFATLPVTP